MLVQITQSRFFIPLLSISAVYFTLFWDGPLVIIIIFLKKEGLLKYVHKFVKCLVLKIYKNFKLSLLIKIIIFILYAYYFQILLIKSKHKKQKKIENISEVPVYIVIKSP